MADLWLEVAKVSATVVVSSGATWVGLLNAWKRQHEDLTRQRQDLLKLKVQEHDAAEASIVDRLTQALLEVHTDLRKDIIDNERRIAELRKELEAAKEWQRTADHHAGEIKVLENTIVILRSHIDEERTKHLETTLALSVLQGEYVQLEAQLKESKNGD